MTFKPGRELGYVARFKVANMQKEAAGTPPRSALTRSRTRLQAKREMKDVGEGKRGVERIELKKEFGLESIASTLPQIST
jgi:hypothetical protein